MISTARIAARSIQLTDRRVLVGGVLAVVIVVIVMAGLANRLAAPAPEPTAASATVRDLAVFSPSIMGDASRLDASTAATLPMGYSDWVAGDQSRELSRTEPGATAVSVSVSNLATFSPSIVGDASRSEMPSVPLPTGYSDWFSGDQSREPAVSE